MIFRERIGDVVVEYEGTPQEINEYFRIINEQNANALQKVFSVLNIQEPSVEEDENSSPLFTEDEVNDKGTLH